MTLRQFLFTLATLFGTALPSHAETKPNIVIILADDFGWGDASCNNSEAVTKTPHIDRLAHEGARFTNAHTPHAVCTPTRCSLLTGRYCWRTELREGVLPAYGKSLIRPGRVTIASLLQDQGYRTGVFGKWHLGLDWVPVVGDPGDWHWGTQIWVKSQEAIAVVTARIDHTAPVTVGPTHLGFDTAFITPSNCTRVPVFIRNELVIGTPALDAQGMMRDPAVERDSVDDFHVKECLAFLSDWKKHHAGDPFFIYLPLNAIHDATRAPKRFKGTSKDGRRGDQIPWLDESVGKVTAALEQHGILDDTLIFFSSDNGPISPGRYLPDTTHRAAGPYRGYKSDTWDGGCRVPLLARWPKKIEARRVSDGLISLTDILPTLAALTGKELPKWAAEDGFNQLPLLFGETDASAREDLITQSSIGAIAIRKGAWKLILGTKGSGGPKTPDAAPLIVTQPWRFDQPISGQLYHIAEDPYETEDLYEAQPDKVEELQNLLVDRIALGRSR
ncbi:MAG: arylsulfatase [Verrucomicrobiota bacterium]